MKKPKRNPKFDLAAKQAHARMMGEIGYNPSGTQGAKSRKYIRQMSYGEVSDEGRSFRKGFRKKPMSNDNWRFNI